MNVGRAGFVCTEPNGIQRRLSALCKVKLESAFSARLATPRLAVGLAIFVIAEAHVVSLKAPALRACFVPKASGHHCAPSPCCDGYTMAICQLSSWAPSVSPHGVPFGRAIQRHYTSA